MSLIRHLVKATGNRQTMPSYHFTMTAEKMSRDQTVKLNLTDTYATLLQNFTHRFTVTLKKKE